MKKKKKKKKECLDDIGKISCYKKIYARLLVSKKNLACWKWSSNFFKIKNDIFYSSRNTDL